MIAPSVALALSVARGETDPVYYAFRRGDALGVAELVVDRPGESFASQRLLAKATDSARVVAMRATRGERRVFVVLERADARNVLAVEPRERSDSRSTWISLAGTPTAATSDEGAAFVASASAVVRIDAEGTSVDGRKDFGSGARIAALARYDDEDLVLAAVSSPQRAVRLAALDEDDLSVDFELDLPRELEPADLLAVSEELGFAVCAARGSAHLAIVDLERAADGEKDAVRASFAWPAPTSAAVTHSLCIADADRPFALVFGALADTCAAIDLRSGSVVARRDAPSGLDSPLHLATPKLSIAAGGGANAVTMLALAKDSKLELSTVETPATPHLVAPVEPRTCVQVVAFGADSAWLVRVDKPRINDTESTLGLPLAAASPHER